MAEADVVVVCAPPNSNVTLAVVVTGPALVVVDVEPPSEIGAPQNCGDHTVLVEE